MIGYLLYSKQYIVAFTESFNHADIFAIKKSHYTIEIEIKVTRDDLRGELNSIRYIMDRKDNDDIFANPKVKNKKKYYKHIDYLNGKTIYQKIMPNEYCFLVTEDLLEIAYAGIKGTPYGLFCYKEYLGNYWHRIEEVLRPEKIHNEKYDFSQNMEILYRASNECQFLREKIYGGWPDQD